ncbi:uncharacterized protein Z519_07777 [Cladophialophora bantiana CBS 173.52]|uniref:Prion-inhibition and propagation HeLo domain-containing protein n=1 Tax=Cladophialophora bantiana (strain ATCC 10958 / CBS 173.52 / CDC B-1940 / NIH 8579) TaxID=1442370 RepID=A0A0D2FZB4_CLAB1|nr:uncharacterized protein Z519_07777 [Cladophialophora bantiana CBS 173.52]KIW91807.1 hypothetical protein Z519_07777 [Cladophialophora bantiana CBS 173.52]
MSGLEALGAVASVVGVAGTIKTCIDLLDILSTARSAEHDLEDLLVHLQWQRVRFYCCVLETGFVDVVVSGQQESTQPDPDLETLLLFLPREFRFPFFLSHIQRTIVNMNPRLHATEQIIHRYCTGQTRSAKTWAERMACFSDTTSTSSIVALQSLAPESRKLGLWDKMRWAGRYVNQLTYLVETLRSYNTELESLLPLSRQRRLERRVERGLLTSRQLSDGLTTPGLNSHVPADSQDLRRAKHYRSLITLLEDSEQPQAKQLWQHRCREAGTSPGSPSSTRYWAGANPQPSHGGDQKHQLESYGTDRPRVCFLWNCSSHPGVAVLFDQNDTGNEAIP